MLQEKYERKCYSNSLFKSTRNQVGKFPRDLITLNIKIVMAKEMDEHQPSGYYFERILLTMRVHVFCGARALLSWKFINFNVISASAKRSRWHFKIYIKLYLWKGKRITTTEIWGSNMGGGVVRGREKSWGVNVAFWRMQDYNPFQATQFMTLLQANLLVNCVHSAVNITPPRLLPSPAFIKASTY